MLSSYSSSLDDMELALKWISSRKVDVDKMITGQTGLEGIQSAVAGLDDRQYRIIVRP
jgi:threonine dehydrogenase-like Zn-dependent dehydrogenase